ncbi:MAG: hypothetical protein AAF556_00060, partial [Pseudomonadota bacterium]
HRIRGAIGEFLAVIQHNDTVGDIHHYAHIVLNQSYGGAELIIHIEDEFGTTMALIEHDMGVVMDISDRVVVLDYGKKLADGTPDAVRSDRAVIDAYLGVANE